VKNKSVLGFVLKPMLLGKKEKSKRDLLKVVAQGKKYHRATQIRPGPVLSDYIRPETRSNILLRWRISPYKYLKMEAKVQDITFLLASFENFRVPQNSIKECVEISHHQKILCCN
jgi:hypothetical protein